MKFFALASLITHVLLSVRAQEVGSTLEQRAPAAVSPPLIVYQPFNYSACPVCPISLITNVNQTISIVAANTVGNQVSTTTFLVRFFDWVFAATKTLTYYEQGANLAIAPTPKYEVLNLVNVTTVIYGPPATVTRSTFVTGPATLVLNVGPNSYTTTSVGPGPTTVTYTQITPVPTTKTVVSTQTTPVTAVATPAVAAPGGAAPGVAPPAVTPRPAAAAAAVPGVAPPAVTPQAAAPAAAVPGVAPPAVSPQPAAPAAAAPGVAPPVVSPQPAAPAAAAPGVAPPVVSPQPAAPASVLSSPATTKFQLVVQNPSSGVNSAPITIDGAGNVVIGTSGQTPSSLSINNAGNLVDASGNVVYIDVNSPKVAKRQNPATVLPTKYSLEAPLGAVSSVFELVNSKTLSVTSRSGSVYDFVFCSSNFSAPQPLWSTRRGDPTPAACQPIILVVKATTVTPVTTQSATSSSSSIAAAASINSITSSTSTSTSTTSAISTSTSTSTSTTSTTSTSRDLVAEATSIIRSQSYQPFCSSLLGYSTSTVTTTAMTVTTTANQSTTVQNGVGTVTAVYVSTQSTNVPSQTLNSTSTPVTTITTTKTVAVTSTAAAKIRRAEDIEARLARAHRIEARQSNANPTPTDLAPYPAATVTAACSQMAFPVNTTSYVNATTTTTTTQTVFLTTPSSSATYYANTTVVTQTNTYGNATAFTTAPTSTSTSTVTATTTITVKSGAPSGALAALYIEPQGSGGLYCRSDAAGHLTDNSKVPGTKEVFIVTASNQLYSVDYGYYYYISDPGVAAGARMVLWSTSASTDYHFMNTTASDGRQELKYALNAGGYGTFCNSYDAGGSTGNHILLGDTAARLAAASPNCVIVRLYMSAFS